MKLSLFDIVNLNKVSVLYPTDLEALQEADMTALQGQIQGIVNSLRKYLAACKVWTIYRGSTASPQAKELMQPIILSLQMQLERHSGVLETLSNKYKQLTDINIEALSKAIAENKVFEPIYDLNPVENAKLEKHYNSQADLIYNDVVSHIVPKKDVNPMGPKAKIDQWVSPSGINLRDKIDLGEDTTSGAVAQYNAPMKDSVITRTPKFHRYLDSKVSCPGCKALSKGWVTAHKYGNKKVSCRYCGAEHSAKLNNQE